VHAALELQGQALRRRQVGRAVDRGQRVAADGQGLGVAQHPPVGSQDHHVVGQESEAVVRQQPQDGARFAGVCAGGDQQGAPVQLDAGSVHEGIAALDEHPPQDGLDDVGVQHVRRPAQEATDGDADGLALGNVDPESETPGDLAIAQVQRACPIRLDGTPLGRANLDANVGLLDAFSNSKIVELW
jgi:hypothetical protein